MSRIPDWSTAIASTLDVINLVCRVARALTFEDDAARAEAQSRAAHQLELRVREQSWLHARLVTDRETSRRRERECPPLYCLCCRRWLMSVRPAQPSGALCFEGGGCYGSAYDQDHENFGLDFYEIFICDTCWPSVRHLAIGTHKRPSPRPVIEHVDGERLDREARRLYGEDEAGWSTRR